MAAVKKKAGAKKAKAKRAKKKPAKAAAKKAPAKPRKPAKPRPSRKSVLALADDPRSNDAVIAAALAALPERARREVVAAWTARVTAGDPALVTRLLAMFELAALGATDAAELSPFIEPLREAGAQPDVFAHLEHAMASERAAVREAV